MSEHDWKPGDVAVANFCGDLDVRVSRYGHGWARLDNPDDFINDGDRYDDGGLRVTDVRPLVVLDPDNREQVQRILDHLAANGAWHFEDESVGEVQAALRSLVAPPRTCSASVNLSGEHFACIEPPEHGGPHRNPDAEAVWGEAS